MVMTYSHAKVWCQQLNNRVEADRRTDAVQQTDGGNCITSLDNAVGKNVNLQTVPKQISKQLCKFDSMANTEFQKFLHTTFCKRHVRGSFKTFVEWHRITKYAHHILSLFNIICCNWNALGPAFLQNSDSIVEELLILLSCSFTQPFAMQITSLLSANLYLFTNSFSSGNK